MKCCGNETLQSHELVSDTSRNTRRKSVRGAVGDTCEGLENAAEGNEATSLTQRAAEPQNLNIPHPFGDFQLQIRHLGDYGNSPGIDEKKNRHVFGRDEQSPSRKGVQSENNGPNMSDKAANILKRFLKGPYQSSHQDYAKKFASSMRNSKESSLALSNTNRRPLEQLNGQKLVDRSTYKKPTDLKGLDISPSMNAERFQRTNEDSPRLTTARNTKIISENINRSDPRSHAPLSQEVTVFEASARNPGSSPSAQKMVQTERLMQFDHKTSPRRDAGSSKDPEKKKLMVERILAGPDPYHRSRSPLQEEEHVKHLLKKGDEIKQKHLKLTREQLKKIQEEHPFKPTLVNNNSPGKARDLNEFLEAQNNFVLLSQMKKLKIKQEMEEERRKKESLSPPRLTERSRVIVENNRKKENDQRSPFERLYDSNLEKTLLNLERRTASREFSKEENGSLFHGKETGRRNTLEVAVDARRDTYQHLYDDAFSRIKKAKKLEKKRETELKKLKKPIVSENSNRLAAEKLIKEFEEQTEKFFAPQQEHRFNYLQMAEFMKILGFLAHVENILDKNFVLERTLLHDIWLVLKGDQYNGVNERNLLLFLLAIMGFDFEIPLYVRPTSLSSNLTSNNSKRHPSPVKNNTKVHSQSPLPRSGRGRTVGSNSTTNLKQRTTSAEGKKGSISERNRASISATPSMGQFGTFDDKENIAFTSEEVSQIRKVYELLHINRMNCTRNIGKPKKTAALEQSKGKIPDMSKYSNALAESYRRKQLEEIVTFMTEVNMPLPENGLITHPDLLTIHAAVKANEVKKRQLDEREAELNKCPFKPTINKITQSTASSPNRRQSHPKEPVRSISPGGDQSAKPRSITPIESLGSKRNEILHAMGKKYADRTDKSHNDWDDEKNREHCTFKPKTKGFSPISRKRSLDNIKAADRSVERIRKAREQQEFIDWFKNERSPFYGLPKESGGYTAMKCGVERRSNKAGFDELTKTKQTANQPAQKTGLNYKSNSTFERKTSDAKLIKNPTEGDTKIPQIIRKDISSHRSTTPSTNQQHNSSAMLETIKKEPLLCVEVNFKKGESDHIFIYEGDNPQLLADRFASEKKLNPHMKNKLKRLLESQIQQYIS